MAHEEYLLDLFKKPPDYDGPEEEEEAEAQAGPSAPKRGRRKSGESTSAVQSAQPTTAVLQLPQIEEIDFDFEEDSDASEEM